MQVNILKFDDTTSCIEAVKLEGDRFYFNNTYREMKGFFGGHVNAVM